MKPIDICILACLGFLILAAICWVSYWIGWHASLFEHNARLMLEDRAKRIAEDA